MKWISIFLLSVLATGASADHHEFAATAAKIKAAMSHERRSEAEAQRDNNRKPVETLEFFQLRDNMTVLELVPGGGWYTKILAPTLEENGRLYVSIGGERIGAALAGQEGFGSLQVVPFDGANFIRTPGSRRVSVPEFSFDLGEEVDLALTFRNMHNFTEEGRMNINNGVFEVLKSGGLYGVVDHTRRHMQSDSNENWRRMDPVQIIKEIESVGFEFVDYSDLHYRADDELRYEVGRKTVTGNTDRFTLLFRKP